MSVWKQWIRAKENRLTLESKRRREALTLTKANFAEATSKETGYTRLQSLELVDSLFEILKQTLANGENVLITN